MRKKPFVVPCSSTLGDNDLRAYIPAPQKNSAWWCNGSTSDSESLPPDLQSAITLEVTADASAGCSTGCSNSPENERGEVVGGSVSSQADSFSAALAMIASLPLSVAEKADAVRRLMAEHAGSSEKSHEALVRDSTQPTA